jgi:rsbT antagonist protein RsbS
VQDHYERIPIIRLFGFLLVPLQGDVTDSLGERLSDEVLTRVHREAIQGVVLDVTGLWMVDSHLCATLSRIAEATAMMGARTFLTGLKPDIALTLETMGLGLRGVTCCRSLEEALQAMGVRLLSEDETRDEDDAESLMMDADGP